MATRTTRIEMRKRGPFGWLFLVLFAIFNLAMLVLGAAVISVNSEMAATAASDGVRSAFAMSRGVSLGLLLVVWALGDVILGSLVLITRGQKTYVQEYVEERREPR